MARWLWPDWCSSHTVCSSVSAGSSASGSGCTRTGTSWLPVVVSPTSPYWCVRTSSIRSSTEPASASAGQELISAPTGPWLRPCARLAPTVATIPAPRLEARRAAYELIVSDPEDALLEAYNNLLVLYMDTLSDLYRASAFRPAALENAPRNPLIYYNAACLIARTGDVEPAIEMLRRAKDGGALTSALAAKAAADPDFASIRVDPRFGAILDEPD
jgi:hypothetical protein